MLSREEAVEDIRRHYEGLYLQVFVGFYAASSFLAALFFTAVALEENTRELASERFIYASGLGVAAFSLAFGLLAALWRIRKSSQHD